jgi:hypothetical protein
MIRQKSGQIHPNIVPIITIYGRSAGSRLTRWHSLKPDGLTVFSIVHTVTKPAQKNNKPIEGKIDLT